MRLVYVGTDGILYSSWRGAAPSAITWGWDEVDADGARTRLRYAWPTCSPDGRRVLAFAHRGERRHFVHVVDANGIEVAELAAVEGAAPIYVNWSPNGRHAGVLVPRDDTLALDILSATSAAPPSCVVRGAPLFWSWSPDSASLVVHAGQSTADVSAGGILLVDAASGEVREVLSTLPAFFRAPSWSADGRLLAFVRPGDAGNRLVLIDPASGDRQSRMLPRGSVAFVWHPRLPIIAYATASDDAPHVYERVVVLDLQADRELVLPHPTLAFFWHPERRTLFRIALDRQREQLSWERHDEDGGHAMLACFQPTRETVFAASFFDQYAASHSPISPDGSAIALAGRLVDDTVGTGPRIYLISTDGGTTAESVGEGVYPVWGV